jgi:hypothetical protein
VSAEPFEITWFRRRKSPGNRCVYQALAECHFRFPAVSIAVSSSPMEHEFTCPYCGEEISMVLDLSVGRQTYIEDCEVCCKPIEISFTVEDDGLASFYAKTLG